MVLNHSSTPIDLEQVEQPEQTFYQQATQRRLSSRKKQAVVWKKKNGFLFEPPKFDGMAFFWQVFQMLHIEKNVWNTELPDNAAV